MLFFWSTQKWYMAMTTTTMFKVMEAFDDKSFESNVVYAATLWSSFLKQSSNSQKCAVATANRAPEIARFVKLAV